jgi:hypothetical protein
MHWFEIMRLNQPDEMAKSHGGKMCVCVLLLLENKKNKNKKNAS